MILEHIPAIITAIGTIIVGFFTYNQYTKNKLTDLKIKKLEEEDIKKNKRRSDNAMLVYGELWDVLYKLKADRVYIVQPHPLGNEEMLTIYFEVKRKGVEPMRPHIQKMKISDVAKFSSELVKNLYKFIDDIDSQVQDKYAKSLLSTYGSEIVIIKRLSDNKHDWVGSIFVEYTKKTNINKEEAFNILHETAVNIQYILPRIED